MLALAALAGGVGAPGGSGEPLAWCDLGCGQGYTTNIVAAANSETRAFGFDFNPAHIANARALASDAGLANVDFREASFQELLADATLPEFDVMCMHGILSWVSPENRRALVALARKRLKPGGLLYISYDCMPGWAGLAPLRRILARHFGPGRGTPAPAAVERALAFADELRAQDPRFHRMFPLVEAQLARLRTTPRDYLAHEILTRDWEAFTFSEVASDLAEAKLAYVGSAHLLDGLDRLNFTPQQMDWLGGLADPVLAETSRDMLLGRQFRRDLFVKGRNLLGARAVRARWMSTRFALTVPAKEVDPTFETPLGKHQFHPQKHQPLIEVFGRGPITFGEALRQAFGKDADAQWPIDVIKVLVARGDLQPALPSEGEAARATGARAFNDAVINRVREGADLFYLASPITGGGVLVDRLTQLYLHARRNGVANPARCVIEIGERAALKSGEGASPSPDELRATVKAKVARAEADVFPLLQTLGIA